MSFSAHLLPLDLLCNRCWCTLVGDTEAATFACCDESAFWTTSGIGVPDGIASPSAHKTRIVRRPDLNLGLDFVPSKSPGVGVEDLSALRLDTEPFFPLNQDML